MKQTKKEKRKKVIKEMITEDYEMMMIMKEKYKKMNGKGRLN